MGRKNKEVLSNIIKNEPIWFGEVATYKHENAGNVMFETVSSTNKEVSPSKDSERITRLGKIRVETKVTEWQGTNDKGQVYQKNVETVQINNDSPEYVSSTNTSTSYDEPKLDEQLKNDLTPLQVLKNFVDNIAADARSQRMLNWTAVAIGAAALMGVLIIAFG